MNKGKCRMKLYRARYHNFLLVWYCTVQEHDHGPHHPIMKKLARDSIAIPADEFYAEMVKS